MQVRMVGNNSTHTEGLVAYGNMLHVVRRECTRHKMQGLVRMGAYWLDAVEIVTQKNAIIFQKYNQQQRLFGNHPQIVYAGVFVRAIKERGGTFFLYNFHRMCAGKRVLAAPNKPDQPQLGATCPDGGAH